MALSVFISAAAEDQAAVNELRKQLAPQIRAGEVDLWHQSDLRGGAVIASERAQRLLQARLIVVILSADWLSDAALLDEVAAARRRGALVLPVRYRHVRSLKGTAADGVQALPKEGAHLLGRTDADVQWSLVADAVLDTPPALTSETTVGDVLRAALRLDRQPQWRSIQAEHKAGGSVLFLLHGHWHQSLDLFAQRMHSHFLRELPGEPHELITLRFPHEEPRPRIAEGWALLLQGELQRRGHPGAALADLLAGAASERSLFLLVGGQPLDEELLEGCEAGLREFLAVVLPQALGKARSRHPVRALLCAQHYGEPGFPQRMLALAPAPGLRYCPLPELTLPQREDIVDYLRRYDPPLPQRQQQAVLTAYDRLARRGMLQSFADLVQLLDQHLS